MSPDRYAPKALSIRTHRSGVKVCFHDAEAVLDNPSASIDFDYGRTGKVVKTIYDTRNGTEELTKKQQLIIRYLSCNGTENGIENASSIATKLGISLRTIMRDIDKLKKLGYIERIGPDKGGYWKVLIKE